MNMSMTDKYNDFKDKWNKVNGLYNEWLTVKGIVDDLKDIKVIVNGRTISIEPGIVKMALTEEIKVIERLLKEEGL